MNTQDLLTSTLASSIRGWRGTQASRHTRQPEKLPELFDCENDWECRLVREAITELNLDVFIWPVPNGGKRFYPKMAEAAASKGLSTHRPLLVDPNTGDVLQGARAINTWLFATYGNRKVPDALLPTRSNRLSSELASKVRGNRGLNARPSRAPEKPLTLYAFESSPYSRPVREVLCELELPYTLITLGKQQRADWGPASFRLHLGPYRPIPGTKRDQMLKTRGRVQVPFLIDPNTGVEMFESADILAYLESTYALPETSMERAVLD